MIKSETTGYDLEEIGRNLKIDPVVVVMKNELFKVPKKQKNIIINLSSNPSHGTHWTALRQNNNNFVYFDSFGQVPPLEVIEWINKTKKLFYNYKEYQHLNEGFCGPFSLLFLWTQENKVNIDDILKSIRSFYPT